MTPSLDASWIPLVALVVGAMTAVSILRIFGAVLSQAHDHYELAKSARALRKTQLERLKEIERAIQAEAKARAEANEQRSAILHAPSMGLDDEVGVDILDDAQPLAA